MASIRKKLAGFLPIAKEKPQVDRKQQLAARPVRNSLVRWEKSEDDEVTLFIPPPKNSRPIGLVRRFVKVPDMDRRIQLDEVGSAVWEMCDGKNDINSIIVALTKRYKLTRREAEVSVLEYFRTLAQKNLIGLAVGGSKGANGK